MRKTLSTIVSLTISLSLLTGCANNNVVYVDTNHTTLDVSGEPIAMDKLGTNPYNTDIKQLWTIDLYAYKQAHTISLDKEMLDTGVFAISGQTAYVLDKNKVLSAYHTETHKLFWQRSIAIDKTIFKPYMSVIGDKVIIAKDNKVYGYDRATGNNVWVINLEHSVNSAITKWNNIALFQSDGSKTFAIDARTGKYSWHHQDNNNDMTFIETSKIVIVMDTAYIVYPLGNVYAIDLNTGSVLWKKILDMQLFGIDSGGGNSFTLEPVIIGRMLYIASSDSYLFALNRKTGDILWQKNVDNQINMVAVGKVLYTLGIDSVLMAINSDNGNVFWRANMVNIVEKFHTEFSNMVFYKGKLVLFTKTGQIVLTSIDIAQLIAIHSTISMDIMPAIYAGKMIVLDKNGKLKAYK